MPKKETAEERKQRIEVKRKKLSRRVREHRYNRDLLMRAGSGTESFGRVKFKQSKEIIEERIRSFKEKYLGENSDFQKRIAYLHTQMDDAAFQKTPEAKMLSVVNDLINKGLREYSEYASVKEMRGRNKDGRFKYVSANNTIRIQESRHLVNAQKHFAETEAELDGLMSTEFGNTAAFNEFYADVKQVSETTRSIVDGGLDVPSKEEEGDYAYFIKLTKTVKDPVTGEDVEVIQEPGFTNDIGGIDKNSGGPKYESMKDYPLFSHEPCPEDIRQGQLGDCYLIATMSALAENNPDFIRNMMKDNHDGTVTVRLFDEEGVPAYVTVNKTIPVAKMGGVNTPVYSNGALWVSILEKAYVQSGVVYGNTENFSQNRFNDERNSYNDIVGGKTQHTTKFLLGDYSDDSVYSMTLDLPKGFDGREYAPEETAFFQKIKEAYSRGDAITAGIREYPDQGGDRAYEKHAGLPGGHAYTVIGTAEMDGKKFIRVRNPHMSGGRGYDRHGRAIYVKNPKVPGESLIELRDYVNTFSETYSARYVESGFEAVQNKLKQDHRMMYGDAINQACEEILNSDAWYVWTNSKTFTDLKKAAINLQAQYNNDPDPQKVEDKMNDLFRAAKAYRDDRDTRKTGDRKDDRSRSQERYRLAEAVGHFEDIFRANKKNDTLEYVDFEACKDLALDVGLENGKLNEAKKATVEAYVKSESRIDKDEKIRQVEEAGLTKIEEGLKQYNTGKLKEGLMEVLLSRSVRANKEKMRPEDVERQLSKEAIDRANLKLGSKIEKAIKSIDKQEFINIMQSGDVGSSMASSVGRHMGRNEAAARKQTEAVPVQPEAKPEEAKPAEVNNQPVQNGGQVLG